MKTVFITGASGAIGAEIAAQFASEGYSIIIGYNTSQKKAYDLAQKLSQKTMTFVLKCDLLCHDDILNATDFVGRNFGGLDILINNCGVPNTGLLQDLTVEDIIKTLDVNLKGTILLTRAFIPFLLKKDNAKIVNISSMWGVSGAAYESVYSASKAALIGFTRALSKELGGSNINVNCVAPGFIDTPMNACYDDKIKTEIRQKTSLKRLGSVEDVANVVTFLASAKASYITGQTILVDGGFLD